MSDLAKQYAEQCGRQEVSIDWFIANMADKPVFRWTSDDDAVMGLDPWRIDPDLDDAAALGWRIFVQKNDMPNG